MQNMGSPSLAVSIGAEDSVRFCVCVCVYIIFCDFY